MAPASGAPCIVWFRDDLRLSDHPALHEAAGAGSPVICLYILDETLPLPRATSGRRGALVVGAIIAVVGAKPRCDRCAAGAAPWTGGTDHCRSGARDRCGNRVLERNRIRALRDSGQSGCPPSGSDRRGLTALPRRSFGSPRPDPQQGRSRLAAVHAVLEAGAGTGCTATAVACAKSAQARALDQRPTNSRTGILNPRGPIGLADYARPGHPAKNRPRRGSAPS